MKNTFYSAFLILMVASASLATEILPKHAGHYRCQCLHEGCKERKLSETDLQLEQAANRLVINYGEETQSGAPARTTHSDGSVTYTLASRGNVSFSPSGEMQFGWGKLWTCLRVP